MRGLLWCQMKANGTAMWELLKVEWREQGDRRESEASLGIPNKNGDDIHLSRITILSEDSDGL